MNLRSLLARLRRSPQIPVALLTGGFSFAVVLVVYMWPGASTERFKDAMDALFGIAVIYTGLYAGLAFWAQHDRDCKAEAFAALDRIGAFSAYDDALRTWSEAVAPKTGASLIAEVAKDDQRAKMLKSLIGELDSLAEKVRIGYADEEVALGIRRRYLNYAEWLKRYIVACREKPESEGGNPRYAMDFIAMAHVWNTRNWYAKSPEPKP